MFAFDPIQPQVESELEFCLNVTPPEPRPLGLVGGIPPHGR